MDEGSVIVKALVVTDKVVDAVYSPAIRERFSDVNLVLACGDLPYSYLEYIVSMLNFPSFFVHGNHDCEEHTAGGCMLRAPGGWVNLDQRTIVHKGLILGGLEGCMRYKTGGRHQYTEFQMVRKVWRMVPYMMLNRLLRGRYIDVLITHAPPKGIHDGTDRAHRGFKVYLSFMERFRPRYLLHGHTHLYGRGKWQSSYLDTQIINTFPYRVIEF
jgi:hypothetical protein